MLRITSMYIILLFIFLAVFLYVISGMGVTAGVHRLWAHRSYKARLPLRILLAFMYTVAFEVRLLDPYF